MLNTLLENTHHQIKDQIAREADQEAHIKTLQESVKTLTHCLNEVTKTGEGYADGLAETKPANPLHRETTSSNNLSFF